MLSDQFNKLSTEDKANLAISILKYIEAATDKIVAPSVKPEGNQEISNTCNEAPEDLRNETQWGRGPERGKFLLQLRNLAEQFPNRFTVVVGKPLRKYTDKYEEKGILFLPVDSNIQDWWDRLHDLEKSLKQDEEIVQENLQSISLPKAVLQLYSTLVIECKLRPNDEH